MIFLTFLSFLCCFLHSSAAAVLPRDPPLPPFITLEKHFTPAEIAFQDAAAPLYIQQKLADVDGLRLQQMDQGRIAKQWASMTYYENSEIACFQYALRLISGPQLMPMYSTLIPYYAPDSSPLVHTQSTCLKARLPTISWPQQSAVTRPASEVGRLSLCRTQLPQQTK